MVRTRFAPSPTGKLHVGGMRTAIFCYLFSKSKNGEFIIRIEDTDRERFVPEGIKYIEDSLRWMDIPWDNENFIHQSDRLDIYAKYSQQLLDEGKAYKCFCSRERLEKLRERQIAAKKPPGYDRHCKNLSKDEIEKNIKERKTFVIRFKIPDDPKFVVWRDLIHGKISIRTDIQEDFIVIKTDCFPTYHLANVVDDHDMEITTVIRGEEWVPSTPKHLLLYQAFGWEPPKYAHTPLIVGKDGKKLSKRNGDTAFLNYKDNGYLPETILNFLSLLGWNPGSTKELFNHDELIQHFSIERVGKSPAVFDIEKLNWINGEKIRAMSVGDLMQEIEDFDPKFVEGKDKDLFKKAVTVLQTRIVTLKDFVEQSPYFFEKPSVNSKLLVFKKSTPEATKAGLSAVKKILESTKEIKTSENANGLLLGVVEENKLTNGDVFWPVRVALSGQERSASPGEILWALGPSEALDRISNALEKL